MSVRQQTPYSVFTGNGFTTVFPFPFKVLAAGDLAVYVAGFLKTLNLDYTVSGVGADAGGNVTFAVAPGSGACVSIIRSMRRERLTDDQNRGNHLASKVDPDLDRAILLLQDMHAQLCRAVRTPADEIATMPTLPPKASRSGKYMAWDANGQPIASLGTGNDTGLRTDLAAKNGDTLVGAKYAQLSAVALNLHDYIEDDGAYNVMGFVPRANKSAIRDHTSTADLAIALQTWADAAANDKRRMFLQTGRYTHAAPIKITQSASMFGAGRYSQLRPDNSNALTFDGQETVGGARVFEKFAIVANNGARRTAIDTDLDSGAGGRITGVTFQNLYVEGFEKVARVRGMWDCIFRSIYGFNNYHGFHLYRRSVAVRIIDCTLVKGSIPGTGDRKGVFTEEAAGTRPEDVKLIRPYIFEYDIGIDLAQVLHSAVIDCDIDYARKRGIRLTQVDGGCEIRGGWIATDNDALATMAIEFVALGAPRRTNVGISGVCMTCNQPFAGNTGVKVESNQDCVSVEGSRITGFDVGIIANNADSFTAKRNSINAVTTAISAVFGEDNEIGPNFIENGTPIALPGGMPPRLRYQAMGATRLSLSGCTTTPQGRVTWVAKDGEVTLTFPVIEGTSRSRAATLGTLPPEVRPASATRTELARVKDDGKLAVGLVEIASNGTINLLPGVGGGAFTRSGTKGIGQCSVKYQI